MSAWNDGPVVVDSVQEVSLKELSDKMDALGTQMNWLCENLQSLFVFVQQVGTSGGGIRGLLKAMNSAPQMKGVDESA